MVSKLKSPRRLAALAVFAIIAMSAFGFAAANTVNPSNAGDGAGVVSGGTASNIHYTLSGTTITDVAFDYTAAVTPTQVSIELRDSASTVIASGTCVAGAGSYDWECALAAPVSIAPVQSLRVVTAS